MDSNNITFSQRKIKKTYRSVRGNFPSIKNNKSISFESMLERQLFLTLEFDNDIKSYIEQPQIEIELDSKTMIYSADCYIKRISTSKKKDTLIEVKYSTELEKKKEYLDKKFKAIKEVAKTMNLDFKIYTEENHSDIYIDNLDFLYRYKTAQRVTKYDNDIKRILDNTNISAENLANKITKSKIEYITVSNAIWGLVAVGELYTDLESEKINMKSKVRINDGYC